MLKKTKKAIESFVDSALQEFSQRGGWSGHEEKIESRDELERWLGDLSDLVGGDADEFEVRDYAVDYGARKLGL